MRDERVGVWTKSGKLMVVKENEKDNVKELAAWAEEWTIGERNYFSIAI